MTNETINIVNSLRWLAYEKCKGVDVDDFMQDIFLRLLESENFDDIKNNYEKKKYISACIRNMSIDRNRKKTRKGRPEFFNPFFDWSATVPPSVYSKIELKEVMEKAQKREDICQSLMMYAEGYKNWEIAEILGSTTNTILGRCRYARNFLRA